MLRKKLHPLWLTLILTVLPVLACSNLLPEPAASIPPPPTLTIPTPQAAATGSFDLAPTATPAGGSAALPATSPVGDGGPILTARVNINVRTGPDVAYARDGFLLAGDSAVITGRDTENGWWQIICPANADGSSCWVTGGSAYVTATNVNDVPVAGAPPLPTTTPTETPAGTENETGEIDPGNVTNGAPIVSASAEPAVDAAGETLLPNAPFLVYVDSGDLFIQFLVEEDGQLIAGTGRQLTTSGGITGVWVNPDGRRLAFVREEAPSNALYVLDLATDVQQRVTGGDLLPPLPGLGTTQQIRYLDQVQWLAGNERILFNTRILPQEPGTGPAYDLWSVRPGEAPVEQLPANTGGATFAVSAQDELLLAQATTILRADLNGTPPETVISFDLVNTASEFLYFPRPQWNAVGEQAHVAIPAANPQARNAVTGLWRIPNGSGAGERTGEIAVNPITNPLFWNGDGSRLAYVQTPAGLLGNTQLRLANGDGDNLETYERGRNLRFLAWGLDPDTFLYSGNGYVAVGRIGEAPVSSLIPAEQVVVAGRWLGASNFLISVRTPQEQWQLISGNRNGDATLLVTFDNPTPIFDHWVP